MVIVEGLKFLYFRYDLLTERWFDDLKKIAVKGKILPNLSAIAAQSCQILDFCFDQFNPNPNPTDASRVAFLVKSPTEFTVQLVDITYSGTACNIAEVKDIFPFTQAVRCQAQWVELKRVVLSGNNCSVVGLRADLTEDHGNKIFQFFARTLSDKKAGDSFCPLPCTDYWRFLNSKRRSHSESEGRFLLI